MRNSHHSVSCLCDLDFVVVVPHVYVVLHTVVVLCGSNKVCCDLSRSFLLRILVQRFFLKRFEGRPRRHSYWYPGKYVSFVHPEAYAGFSQTCD